MGRVCQYLRVKVHSPLSVPCSFSDKKASSYIAQYPVLRTVQSALHFYYLAIVLLSMRSAALCFSLVATSASQMCLSGCTRQHGLRTQARTTNTLPPLNWQIATRTTGGTRARNCIRCSWVESEHVLWVFVILRVCCSVDSVSLTLRL